MEVNIYFKNYNPQTNERTKEWGPSNAMNMKHVTKGKPTLKNERTRNIFENVDHKR